MQKKNYQIRHAGGKYWLLDMEQDGIQYNIPSFINETGMYIYTRMCDGKDAGVIAQEMHNDFSIDVKQALSDVEEFICIMREKGL